jgi:hypothetical protein
LFNEKVDLSRVGGPSNAKGDARFRVREACDSDLRVQVENVPSGDYPIFVGGVERGVIGVAAGQGEIEFDNTPAIDEQCLTFDPRGQTIEIRQNGSTILTVNFPS